MYDNIGLMQAVQSSQSVIPCFIFTPEQIKSNPYRSDRCLKFMIESLEDLERELKTKGKRLYFFYGEPEKIVERCIKELAIDGVFVNRDYTPYSQGRDQKIASVCRKYKIPFNQADDALLISLENGLKSNGDPYTVFTPFFRHASQTKVAHPQNIRIHRFFNGPIGFARDRSIFKKVLPTRLHTPFQGGRKAGLKILARINDFKDYRSFRDFPARDTTHLSAYLKFNVCSIREVYHAIASELGSRHELIRSLYWRDFFTATAFHFPRVFQGAFREKFNHIPWRYQRKVFHRWCQGQTGFPIVDAGMRELNETGFMHNRVRMICASFLVKDLHIDWRWGEKYFAQKLIDYDPAVNNGNWQWVASTGCDAQPYFRIFNPWNQQKRFDSECVYIKRWVPELQSLAREILHRWDLEPPSSFYLSPMLDHAKESQKSLQMFRSAIKR